MADIKNTRFVFSILVIMLLSFSIVSAALTVSIRNAVIVVRPNVGDQVEKYVTVENTNDVDISVYLNSSGDLADNIKFRESQATLKVGETRNFYYTIDVKEAGNFKAGIDVSLPSPDGKGAGARLSQVVWVVTKGEASIDDVSDLDDTSPIDPITGNIISSDKPSPDLTPYIVLSLTTLVLLAGLVLLIYFARKKRAKAAANDKTKIEAKTKSKKEMKMDEV